MANIQQTRVISDPSVYISDILIKHIPNSVKMRLGGETVVRTVSAGGGRLSAVAGVNAEKKLAHVAFDIATTLENIEMVRSWKANANEGNAETVRIADKVGQFAFVDMYLMNEPEINMRSDGNISIEFSGLYIE